MEFKKIYVEITNNCNLNCSFCPKNNRVKQFITIDKFKIILNRLRGYTKYLYFHVMGEPLLHPEINNLIDIASKEYYVNLTTNGYLIKKIKDNKNIRQINISLHSYNPNLINIEKYMNDIFDSVDKLSENTFISYRLWVENEYGKEIIAFLEDKYQVKITDKHQKLTNNIYFDVEKEFIWPDLKNTYYNEIGSCMGTRSHIGILIDGTIIPCCLDNEGVINLGNIYNDSLEQIITSNRFKLMQENFKQNKKCEELCKHCNFYDEKK